MRIRGILHRLPARPVPLRHRHPAPVPAALRAAPVADKWEVVPACNGRGHILLWRMTFRTHLIQPFSVKVQY